MIGRKPPRDPPTLACLDSDDRSLAKVNLLLAERLSVETIPDLRQTPVFRVKAPYYLTRMRGWRGKDGNKFGYGRDVGKNGWSSKNCASRIEAKKRNAQSSPGRNEREGATHMDRRHVDKPGPTKAVNRKLSTLEFEIVTQAFVELFALLQEYAPVWYTEQHHNRASVAYGILQKTRRVATSGSV